MDKKFKGEALPEWGNVPLDIKKHQGFTYLIYNKVNGMKYIGKKKFWFKNNKKLTRKPTKVEALRLDRYSITNKDKYKDYKIVLKNKYKGKTKKVKGVKESDWKTYWGSCKQLHCDIEKYGYSAFKRVIIECYKSDWECSYNELVLQIKHDVLFKKEFYNGIIQVRLKKFRSMVK